MSAAPEHGENTSINWIGVILLGLVLPIAVVTVVAMLVTTSPRLPKSEVAEATKQAAAAPAASTAAPAATPAKEAPKSEAKPAAKPESKPDAKAKPEAEPEEKPAAAEGGKGKAVYASTCAACHATGAAGAPKFGDKAAWAPRIKTGKEALYTSALKGKNAMPAKGGNAGLPDADAKAAVDYMVAGSQ